MLQLRLQSDDDTIDFAGIEKYGYGVQVGPGSTGFGLPPGTAEFIAGAGDGARYRGTRLVPRDSDYVIQVQGRDRADLENWVARLSAAFAGQSRLIFHDTDNPDYEWYQYVAHVGGGQFGYGIDTDGETGLKFVVTLRAGDPCYTNTRTQVQTIQTLSRGGLLKGRSLTKLGLSSSQTFGRITLNNSNSDTEAFPVWQIFGPCTAFRAVSPSGQVLAWNGTLVRGDVLTIDCRPGGYTVKDQHGANRYSGFDKRPIFWSVPKGITGATATLTGSDTNSKILLSWQARRRVII